MPQRFESPRVDVVIPVFNCENTVAASLASIQAQTIEAIRVFVIDDGSTDETLSIVRRLAASDHRIAVLTKTNSGIVDTLNLGLAHGTASFVARHDGDDLADPTRFARQIAYLDAHADCVALGTYARLIDRAGVPLGGFSRPPSPDLADPAAVPSREPYLLHPFVMLRRSAIDAIGGYRHNFLAEDSDLFWRLQERGRLFNLPEVLGDYRVHGDSTTSQSVHRGRANALYSELGALSARRRRSRKSDLPFTASMVTHVRAQSGMARMLDAAPELGPDERAWLEVATAAKLIELSFIRRYELERDDCRFIGAAFRTQWHALTPRDRAANTERLIQFGKHLVDHGRVKDALTALPARLYHRFLMRVAFQRFVPSSVRDALRKRMTDRASRPDGTPS